VNPPPSARLMGLTQNPVLVVELKYEPGDICCSGGQKTVTNVISFQSKSSSADCRYQRRDGQHNIEAVERLLTVLTG